MNPTTTLAPPYYLAVALSLWLGWGIRGNYGHEYGAMIPGALAALAVALMSGRPDWHRRAAEFAWLGALGWSFGGSMSYMQVVAYTHSGHSPSVIYGFTCLFVIGFLWAAPGGAGTALAAIAPRRFLADLVVPMSLVFVFWWLQGLAIAPGLRSLGVKLDWFDTDWLAATLALLAGFATLAIRRRLDDATGLVLCMAGGWWLGFAVLVPGLGLRMTPPRGDNWAGCVGLVLGALGWLARCGLGQAARAGLVCGFIGGIGFAAASMLKLVEVTSGFETNWHSILEQTTGTFNGLALAVAMAPLARFAPAPNEVDAPPGTGRFRPDAALFALGFVVLAIPYLNLRKNVEQWLLAHTVPETLAGLSAWVWFDLGCLLMALTFLALMVRHRRRPIAIVPGSPLGRGQLLYVVLLWWIVAGNFDRIVVAFTPQRLVTEGVLHMVALACTLVVLGWTPPAREVSIAPARDAQPWLKRTLALGVVAAALSVVVDWGVVRAIYGDRFAGHASLHIRFGPNATTRRAERR